MLKQKERKSLVIAVLYIRIYYVKILSRFYMVWKQAVDVFL